MINLYFKIKVDEAVNGSDAVELFTTAMNKPCKCKNRAYKLILMDI